MKTCPTIFACIWTIAILGHRSLDMNWPHSSSSPTGIVWDFSVCTIESMSAVNLFLCRIMHHITTRMWYEKYNARIIYRSQESYSVLTQTKKIMMSLCYILFWNYHCIEICHRLKCSYAVLLQLRVIFYVLLNLFFCMTLTNALWCVLFNI